MFFMWNADPPNHQASTLPSDPSMYRIYIIDVLSQHAKWTMSEGIVDLTHYLSQDKFAASGGYGDIFTGVWKSPFTGQYTIPLPSVAIKVMRVPPLHDDRGRAKRTKLIKRELRVLQELNHRNLLPLIGITCLGDPDFPAIVSPWMSNGTVMEYMKKNPDAPVVQFLAEIADGIDYLHNYDPEVIHGDMKASNVLVDHLGRIYIGDFGLSRLSEDSSLWVTSATHAGGSTRWSAPELLNADDTRATRASDIYSYAMTCFEMISGLVPFNELRNDVAVIKAVAFDNKRPSRRLIPKASDDMWELITQCWNKDPLRRIDARMVAVIMNRLLYAPPSISRITAEVLEFSCSLGRLACSPTESKVVVIMDNAVLLVLDLLTGHQNQVSIWEPYSTIRCVAYSPDGSLLAAGSSHGVTIWDARTWEIKLGPLGGSDDIFAVAFSPDGKWLASSSHCGQVHTWDTDTGDSLNVFMESEVKPSYGGICSIGISPRRQIAAAYTDRSDIVLWDVGSTANGRSLSQDDQTAPCTSLAFRPAEDSDSLVAGYRDGKVTLWDTHTFKAMRVMRLHDRPVSCVVISPDGGTICSSSEGGTICVNRTISGETIRYLIATHANSVAFSPSGGRIISSCWDKKIRIWSSQL